MMRARYGEPSDTADEDERTLSGAASSGQQQGPTDNAARLNRNDFRIMCANERLYEAYSELHCLAQGEWWCL